MSQGAVYGDAGIKNAGDLAVHFGRGIKRSIAAFLLAVLVLPLVSVWATYRIRTLSGNLVAVEETRLLFSRALRYATDEEDGLHSFLETGHSAFYREYVTAGASMNALLPQLAPQFAQAHLADSRGIFDDFMRSYSQWRSIVALPLLAHPRRQDADLLEARGRALMDEMRADVAALHQRGRAAITQTTRRMTDEIAFSVAVAAVWVLLVAIFTILVQRRAVDYERRLVERIIREREEVRNLSEWRSRLLAMLAHDFKSQLTVLIGASHLLEDFPDRRGDPHVLASLRGASYALAEMADNAILLARAQERKIILQRSIFDVAEAVDAVVLRYGSERDFHVLRCLSAASVDADRSYVVRVLDNVFANAVKYSDAPVHVRLEDCGAFVCIRVIDRGQGIPEDELPHVFDEFWRSNRTSWKRGSGVGLFIVKTIMDAHGGNVSIESRVGYGTTVTLGFPRGIAGVPEPEIAVPVS